MKKLSTARSTRAFFWHPLLLVVQKPETLAGFRLPR